MQIHLRKSGEKKPSVIIEDVLYFEQLPDQVQYTVAGDDETSFMDLDEEGNYLYGTESYDFCQVYAK